MWKMLKIYDAGVWVCRIKVVFGLTYLVAGWIAVVLGYAESISVDLLFEQNYHSQFLSMFAGSVILHQQMPVFKTYFDLLRTLLGS